MWIKFCNAFTKITAWPLQRLCFRTRARYEDATVQKRKIKGPAIIVCNHTSIYDYAVLLFVFFSRTLRCQMAELLFRKPVLGPYLRAMGGILVDRNAHDFGFVAKSEKILRRGGVVCIFPERRVRCPLRRAPRSWRCLPMCRSFRSIPTDAIFPTHRLPS